MTQGAAVVTLIMAIDRGAVSLFDGGAVSLFFGHRVRVMYGGTRNPKNPKF
jgi:hypothetical protein